MRLLRAFFRDVATALMLAWRFQPSDRSAAAERLRTRGARWILLAIVAGLSIAGGVLALTLQGPTLRGNVLLGQRFRAISDRSRWAARMDVAMAREQAREGQHLLMAEWRASVKALENIEASESRLKAERQRAEAARVLDDLEVRHAGGLEVDITKLQAARQATELFRDPAVPRLVSPTYAMWMAPLSHLPLGWLRWLWIALQTALLIAIVIGCARLARAWYGAGERYVALIGAVTTIACLRFLWLELASGDTALLALAGALLGWGLIGARRELTGGVVVGLTCSLHLAAAPLLIWLAWRRRWRPAGAGLAVAGALFLAPMIWLGPQTYVRNVDSWTTQLNSFQRQHDLYNDEAAVPFSFGNQALRQMIWRAGHLFPYAREDRPTLLIDLLHLPGSTVHTLITIAYALLIAITLLCCGPRRPRSDGMAWWVELALLLTLILLLGPVTYLAAFVALVLPVTLLASHALLAGDRLAWRLLMIFWLLTQPLGAHTLGPFGETLLTSHYLPTLGLLLIWVALLRLRRQLQALPPGIIGLDSERGR